MVHDEVGDHADAALVGGLDERADVVDRPVVGVDVVEVGDVVAAVAQRRRVHRQQPDAVDAEPLQVVELLGQAAEVARAVAVAVEEAAQVDLVEDRGLEPQRVGLEPVVRRRRCRPRPCCAGVPRGSTWRLRGAHCRVEAHVVAADAPVEALARRAGRSTVKAGGRPRSSGTTTTPSWASCGSRLTTEMTVLSPRRAWRRRSARRSRSSRKWMLSRCWSAGFSRRIALRRRDQRQQRAVERALLDLVLLGVEVLLAARLAPATFSKRSKPE